MIKRLIQGIDDYAGVEQWSGIKRKGAGTKIIENVACDIIMIESKCLFSVFKVQMFTTVSQMIYMYVYKKGFVCASVCVRVY